MTALFNSDFAIPGTSAAVPPQMICPGDLPLVLLPIRLETRFFTIAGGATELRVRIYPDKIHLDSHERDLTADEQMWGQHYWEQNWRAGTNKATWAEPWQQLADRFGAPRAAWIVRVLQPTNEAARPGPPTPPNLPLNPAPIFPAITVANQDATWRHPPQARLLPDRWMAIVHSDGHVASTVTGNPIRRPLAVGPDPQAP